MWRRNADGKVPKYHGVSILQTKSKIRNSAKKVRNKKQYSKGVRASLHIAYNKWNVSTILTPRKK